MPKSLRRSLRRYGALWKAAVQGYADGFSEMIVEFDRYRAAGALVGLSTDRKLMRRLGMTLVEIAERRSLLELEVFERSKALEHAVALPFVELPIQLFADEGWSAGIDYLLAKGYGPIDALTRFGETPLLCAAAHGHMETAKHLAELGANIAATCADTGRTALHMSARTGISAEDMAEWVIQLRVAEIDVDMTDACGFTPLSLAIDAGRWGAVKGLLVGGADPNHKYESRRQPLHHAAQAKEGELVRLLLRYGAEVSATTGADREVLRHFGVRGLRMLLRRGIRPRLTTSLAIRTLGNAVELSCEREIAYLLEWLKQLRKSPAGVGAQWIAIRDDINYTDQEKLRWLLLHKHARILKPAKKAVYGAFHALAAWRQSTASNGLTTCSDKGSSVTRT
jgi:hypothetical protein